MIRNMMQIMAALMLSLATFSVGAFGQRGTGEQQGLAQQAEKPKVVTLDGKVVEVTTGPCQQTTGRATSGTHFTLLTAAGEELNIHLGPKVQVEKMAKQLTVEEDASVEAFRTDRLPDNAYIAKSITIGDETIQVRDESLRPVWAGRSAMLKGQGRWSAGIGPGPGCGVACLGTGQGGGPAACRAGPCGGRGCCALGGLDSGRGPQARRGLGMGTGIGAGRGRRMGSGAGVGPANTSN